MSEVILLCFFESVEKPFKVLADKANTIKGLKELILSRIRRIINEKKVDILWKDPSKLLKDVKLLKDKQNITSIGKFFDDHI